LDINKGDEEETNYRSRLVAKDFNTGKEDGIFAATPPLEALKLLLTDVATVGVKGTEDKIMMINDVARAFFEADMRNELCVELPEEDKEEGEGDLVGYLVKSLYGTRDAAANFQKEVWKFMEGIGFTRGRYNPCTFLHKGRGIKCLVHGDDFVSSGSRKDLEWLRIKMTERFEIKTKKVGLGPEELRETRILNRVVRVTEQGWEYEADQRHGELVVNGMGMEGAKGVVTPGEEVKMWNEDEEEEKLVAGEASEYRGLAARANYLALDRSDIQFSTKEVCRGMANPSVADKRRLKRLGRFLIEKPRVVLEFRWQGVMEEVSGYSDSDWAGCRRTAKSTSGGALMWGGHCLKSWSSTQKNITLSSGEAELVAAVKMSTELIGITQLAFDWGMEVEGRLYVDSSAAMGVVNRRGNGRLRHVRVGMLWIQEKVEEGDLKVSKVLGTENPADAMTKYLPASKMEGYMDKMGQAYRGGRAVESLKV
jgi:hypothetical protein